MVIGKLIFLTILQYLINTIVYGKPHSRAPHPDFQQRAKRSHVSKRKHRKIIHVRIRSSRSIHPASNISNPRLVNSDDHLTQTSQGKTNSDLKNMTYRHIAEVDSSENRFGTVNNHHRTLEKQKKSICSQRCVIGTIIASLLLAIVIAVVLAVVLTRTTKISTSTSTVLLRWNSSGVTVAGLAGSSGINSSQLQGPYGLALDTSGSLYVADYLNNRVQKWSLGTLTGITVAGQANTTFGIGSSYLNRPVGILLDSNDNLYVVERSNQRVQFWPQGASTGAIIAGTTMTPGSSNNLFANPSQIVGDPSTGTFYIADTGNHRVMYYRFNASAGTVVAGGNNAGSNNTQLYTPVGMYFDTLSSSLIIANYDGHNIVRWTLGDNHWTLVAGDINGLSGSSSTFLNGPLGVTLDPMGNVYVADQYNARIQLFLAGQSTGMGIAGVTGVIGSNSTLLSNPFWVLLDNQLNLYVSDLGNNRVQKFNRY